MFLRSGSHEPRSVAAYLGHVGPVRPSDEVQVLLERLVGVERLEHGVVREEGLREEHEADGASGPGVTMKDRE